MKRTAFVRTTTLLVLLAMLVAIPALGGCDNDKETPETPVATGEADTAGQDGEQALPANAEDGSGPAASPNAPLTMTVRLAWVSTGENALGIERTVPYSEAVATAAMNALLAGPTAEEQATWPAISSAIPAGTELLGLKVENGIAMVDLSEEFESGGGTFSVTARIAQVVYTLTQFPTVQGVEFYIEGTKVEMFSTEGLILDGPQTIDDVQHTLPMDA